MHSGTLRVSGDVAGAAWIAPRLTGGRGTVTRAVPDLYPAYGRICHPVRQADGTPSTWSQVAAATGRRAHPLMQWHRLVASATPDGVHGSWSGSVPDRGNLHAEALAALCGLLTLHTTTPGDCHFCLWNGQRPTGGPDPDDGGGASASAPVVDPPWLRLGDCTYLLLTGPLHGALEIGWRPSADWFDARSPHVFWPTDRAWYVTTGVDGDSTLVGGSRELVDAVLAVPSLDAWPVGPDDSLAPDADGING